MDRSVIAICHHHAVARSLLLCVLALLVVPDVSSQAPSLQVTISVHPTQQINVEQLYLSAVPITYVASSNWNVSCVVSKFTNDLFTVSPLSTRFGFSVRNMFPQFNAAAPSDVLFMVPGRLSNLVVVYGPTQRYLPELFQESVTIAFPSECFAAAATNAVAVSPVVMEFTAVNDRTTQERISLVASVTIALAAVASGSTGWIGLTSLQTFVVMANSTCAETYTSHYFDDAAGIVGIPFYTVLDGHNPQVFGVSIGCCVGLLAVHALTVTVVRRCSGAASSRVTWRLVAQRLFFPGPFLFASVYLWLSITVTAYREVVRSEGGTFTRPALVVAWGVLAGLLSIVWYDGLKRGFDGHFALYPWFSQQVGGAAAAAAEPAEERSNGESPLIGHTSTRRPVAARLNIVGGGDQQPSGEAAAAVLPFQCLRRFGRFQFFLLPKGRWVNTRGFGVVRANCDDRSYRFAALTLVAVAVFGAVVVNNTECDWYFGSIMIVEMLYLAAFCAMRPFRVPLLNIVWLGMKVTVLVVCALHLYWLEHADTPSNKTAISIRLACTSFIGLCGIFVGYNLVTNFVERSVQTSELLQRVLAGGASEGGALRSRQARLLRWLRGNDPSPKQQHATAASRYMRLDDLEQPMLGHQLCDDIEERREGDNVELLAIYARPLASSEQRTMASYPHYDDEVAADPLSFLGTKNPSYGLRSPLQMADGQPGDAELEDILVEMAMTFGPVAANGHQKNETAPSDPRSNWNSSLDPRVWRTNAASARESVNNLLRSFWAPPSASQATATRDAARRGMANEEDGMKVLLRQADQQLSVASPTNKVHKKQKRLRVVLKIEPPPPTLTNDQFAFIIEAASGPGTVLDMSTLGNAVFVGMRGLPEAKAAGSALHGRWMFGTTLSCVVIEDAAQK